MQLKRITDDRGAVALADLLNGDRRPRPVVVVTIPIGRTEPYVDAEEILEEVGDLAEVYLITTGPQTWTFSDRMPALTQVYGGAGRAYPVGHAWVTNPYESPLHFAHNEEEGDQATRALISDALRMAAAAGLVQRGRARHRTRADAVVVGIPVPERALVKFDGQIANVAQELTEPDVPLDRVLAVGMHLTGWIDSMTRRFDISDELLEPSQSLQSYRKGDLVLARVHQVKSDVAQLLLHPRVAVPITRADVTVNPHDDLRSLLTAGEVLPARVLSAAPHWRLTLLDVDDDETPVRAVSLLAGGPPWLLPPPAEEALMWAEDDPATVTLPAPLTVTPVVPEISTTEVQPKTEAPSAPKLPRVTPAALASRKAIPPTTSSAAATTSMALTIDGLRAKVGALEADLGALREQMRASDAERADLVSMRHDLERKVARLEHELQLQRARLRKSKQPPRPDRAVPEFADVEQGFRYLVLTAWATRTPVGEQAARPLPPYDIGPNFLDSLETTPGISLDKVADVVVEILTGLADELTGRDVHQLRESPTANADYLRRADGATCWRAALQIRSPQARRIHYWRRPGGRVELSRVTLHDDFDP